MKCTRCKSESERVERKVSGYDSVFITKHEPKPDGPMASRPTETFACTKCGLVEEFVKW